MSKPTLSLDERRRYEWQLWIEGFGEEQQRRLKASTVLVSRCGGVGGVVAQQLAAAGVGRLILAHGGPLRLNDLNRQVLMRESELGQPRAPQAAARLRELNSHIEVVAVDANVSEDNAAALVAQADVVASCAPRFEERLLLNRAAVAQRKILVDCAMYELELQLLVVQPGATACLACLFPAPSPLWKREFPVLGAAAATVAALGAVEIIKAITGLGQPLAGQMLVGDLAALDFYKVQTRRNPACAVCAGV